MKFKLKSECAGVLFGEILLYNKFKMLEEWYDIHIITDVADGCVVDFTLYEFNTDDEIMLSFQERENIFEQIENLV